MSVRPLDGVLLPSTPHWPDEIRDSGDLDVPGDVTVSSKEVATAQALVDAMAMRFDPGDFKDEYEEAVEDIVKAKVAGREVVEVEEPEAETTVVDLMSALKASVERAKEGEEAATGRGKRTAAERKRTTTRRRKSA